MGFESGSIKDPEAYKIDDNTRFITFLAKDIKSKKQALGFIKGIKEKMVLIPINMSENNF